MIGVAQIVSGDEAKSVTHIGYLVASVAVLPLVLNTLEGDRSKWSTAIIGGRGARRRGRPASPPGDDR